MAVLLIGSTGNGKSTLGNYLLNPEFMKPGNPRYFEMATDNLPKTKLCSVRRANVMARHQSEKLAVIDTPGLNESKIDDFDHIIKLIKTLKREDKIQACIFVVKFSLKIDQQYKDTIEYYYKLLPSLFDNNVIIVVTDYGTDEYAVEKRKMEEIDEIKTFENIKAEILKTTKLNFNPILFSIDCKAITKEGQAKSSEVREAILSRIFTLEPINIRDFKVAKTKGVMEDDEKVVKECNGRIDGYNLRLIEVNRNAEEALTGTQRKENELTSINNELIILEDRLRQINTEELVTVGTWNCDDTWKFLKKQSKEFEQTTDFDISKIEKWTNGHCEIEILKGESKRIVKGKVKGEFMRGLYANVTLKAKKSDKYEDEISRLQAQIEAKRTLQAQAQEGAQEYRKQHSQFKMEIESLDKFIADTRKEIERHATLTLSLEEACDRLAKLQMAIEPK